MSEENVEIVRRAAAAFNRRDVDAWLAHFDPDVVWYAFPDEPEPGPFRGHDAIRAMAARWMEVLSDFRIETKEYVDAGEYVLMPARMLGRIADSDADVTIDEVYVNKCRDGKIVEVRECRTRAEAIEAVGLRE
ncbi:MAG: nuclear transport factor 2 family protein [Thermoleophilaceae bacterium]